MVSNAPLPNDPRSAVLNRRRASVGIHKFTYQYLSPLVVEHTQVPIQVVGGGGGGIQDVNGEGGVSFILFANM